MDKMASKGITRYSSEYNTIFNTLYDNINPVHRDYNVKEEERCDALRRSWVASQSEELSKFVTWLLDVHGSSYMIDNYLSSLGIKVERDELPTSSILRSLIQNYLNSNVRKGTEEEILANAKKHFVNMFKSQLCPSLEPQKELEESMPQNLNDDNGNICIR